MEAVFSFVADERNEPRMKEAEMKILVAYATCHGSTAEIAQRIADRLRASGDTVDCQPMTDLDTPDGYEAAVLGSPIHDQDWLPEATGFLARFGPTLGWGPVWLFSVGMPGALPGRLQGWAMQEEGQMAAKLASLIQSRGHRLFSGVIYKEHLTPGGRAKFRLMGGRYGDFRDWDAIEAWADSAADALHPGGQRSASA